MATAAELIAERLHAAGCRLAFGVPGGEVLALVEALTRRGLGFVLVKHENAGAFMAQAAARAGGAPGVLVATLGPGVANAVNAVASALQDRIPLIVLAGRVDAAEAATYTHQVIDHAALFAPVTKGVFTMADGAVDTLIDKAVNLALDGRPGPVLVDLPVSVAAAPQPARAPVRRPRAAPAAPAAGPGLDAARALLAAAERPLMIAGLDVINDGSADAVARFVTGFAIPLITTYNAKGVLPEDHPLAIGAAALSPRADTHLKPLVAASDCILTVGYDPIEMRSGWRDPWPADAPVIEMAAAPAQHGMHAARHVFVCHTGEGLAALAHGLSPRPTWPRGEPAAARAALRKAFAPGKGWGPAAAIEAVRGALPRDGVLTLDTGAHRILAAQMWPAYAPGTVLQSVGFGTMGCALPLAIGRKLASPATPVVAMTGDAGLEMVLGELATLRDLRLPVVIVVFADQALALIEMKQRAMQLPRAAVDFGATDFPAVARALGGVGVAATDAASLSRAVKEGLARDDAFTLISVSVPPGAYDDCI
jgi:acetolactate synthase-1/2/3 large subunit